METYKLPHEFELGKHTKVTSSKSLQVTWLDAFKSKVKESPEKRKNQRNTK